MKIFCFDIDGTLCSKSETDYSLAEPYVERINQVNKLYEEETKLFCLQHGEVKQDLITKT